MQQVVIAIVLLLQMMLCNETITAQRKDQLINDHWQLAMTDNAVAKVKWISATVPHNADDYYGYRRMLHGNLHGSMMYKKTLLVQPQPSKHYFLYFEGVGSYAEVYVNNQLAGKHAGGRTTFTIDITPLLKPHNSANEILVKVNHPAFIKDLPWVCGGCSDERGFSEGSQPFGIFRPVHLIVTNDVRIVPFGVHTWANVYPQTAKLNITATLKNYRNTSEKIALVYQLLDAGGNIVNTDEQTQLLSPGDSVTVTAPSLKINQPKLWSPENPYLYHLVTIIRNGKTILDTDTTAAGFRTISWNNPSHQFVLNGKPYFINGIAEYEHLLGGSHAFSEEEIIARMNWIQNAGFNALRDAHQPHNLLYGQLCDARGLLWWSQFSAHIWYDTKEFRNNFKALLHEWVIERRNEPSLILWGLQNESKLPKDFAAECTALIRELDPTASTERLVTTCNGGEGTDWDVPQNWTGTYGGDPVTYAQDIKKQILIGEYGAWRTLDLHTEGGFKQNGLLSEERMTQLMEQKLRLAESVRDSCAGQFFWLLTSHDNPGRVQGGEGLREMDRIGPVNYKGMLTTWEEPTAAYYMYRSNYVSAAKQPMVHIDAHNWPNRWLRPGIKDSINVYSNCDEVELFNDVNGISLGKQKRNGIGTHFQWNGVPIKFNVLYAVGYVNCKAVTKDSITLFHLLRAPHFKDLFSGDFTTTKAAAEYEDVYRINCGGPEFTDGLQQHWYADEYYCTSWTDHFPGMPKQFASQRRIFDPIKNTTDWKLFQSFRYGRNQLRYDFNVDADAQKVYRVELYFVEPWLGTAGEDATGMRIFDVAINGKTVIKNLDIWKEAGTHALLKKVLYVKAVDGKISITFPSVKAGQAVISGIVIAGKKATPEKIKSKTKREVTNWKGWLDIGDYVFKHDAYRFHALPSELFGAHYFQLTNSSESQMFDKIFRDTTDIFVAVKADSSWKALQGFTRLNSEVVTDQQGGKNFTVYKKRYGAEDSIHIPLNSEVLLFYQPVNNMQPAYDLKPVQSYRPAAANFNSALAAKASVNGKESIVFKEKNTAIEWKINIGAADIYSVNIRYSNETGNSLSGKMQWVMADGTLMKEEKIIFTPSEKGKWNYVATNTGTMVNAGNYLVRIIAEDAIGVNISGLDIQ